MSSGVLQVFCPCFGRSRACRTGPRACCSAWGRKRRTGRPVRHQRPQRGKIRRQDRVIRGAPVAQPIQQRLANRPQRRKPIRRRRTADQDDLPPLARPIGRFCDQPGLANTCLAGDDGAGAATASRPAEDLCQCGQLLIPADKEGTPHARNCRMHPSSERHRRPVAFSELTASTAEPDPLCRQQEGAPYSRGPRSSRSVPPGHREPAIGSQYRIGRGANLRGAATRIRSLSAMAGGPSP